MPHPESHPQIPLPPPLVFAGFTAGALLLNLPVALRLPWIEADRVGGGFFIAGGLLLGFLAIRQMLQAHTSPDPSETPAALVTAGPYRLTRNPIYLGFFLVYLGITFVDGTAWGLLLAPALLLVVTQLIVRAEETYLASRFTERYGEYSARVHRWW